MDKKSFFSLDPIIPMKQKARLVASAVTLTLLGVCFYTIVTPNQKTNWLSFGPNESQPEKATHALLIKNNPAFREARHVMRPSFLPIETRRVDSLTTGYQHYEPTILVSHNGETANQDSVTAVWMEFRPVDRVMETHFAKASSTDGGRSYTQEELTQPLPSGFSASFKPFDPMHAVHPESGDIYLGGINRVTPPSGTPSVGIWNRTSIAGGALSNPVNFALVLPYVDKGWMAASRQRGTIHMAYVAATDGILRRTYLQSSFDYGVTFNTPFALSNCVTGPLPRVSNLNKLYVFCLGNIQGYLHVGDSSVGSVGSSRRSLPRFNASDYSIMVTGSTAGSIAVGPFIIGALDPTSQRIYAAYTDISHSEGIEKDLDVLLTYSDDDGATWSTPIIVTPDPIPFADQFLPWLEVDRSGRLHLAWMDTQQSVASDASTRGFYDVYYATSEDAGLTWQASRLTPSSIDSDMTNVNTFTPSRLSGIGDYLSIALSNHAAYVAYPGRDGTNMGMYVSRIDFPANPETIFADSFEGPGL